jgi:RimJ/RimL family protein N-acetyltransferase
MTDPQVYATQFGIPPAEGLRDFLVSGEVSPEFLAYLDIIAPPDPWADGFAAIHRQDQLVIGLGSFKGAPDAQGMVEIAYAIVPQYEGCGLATEVATALLDMAWGDASVQKVWAHTLPTQNASTHVLAKCGFAQLGLIHDPDDGPVWRWECARSKGH